MDGAPPSHYRGYAAVTPPSTLTTFPVDLAERGPAKKAIASATSSGSTATPSLLQTFYQGRTKLGVAVFPEDVAEAIAYFAGPRSAKSTGNVVNVDGGVTAAYPR